MVIAISGKSGCGNTTVSTMLAQKLNLKLINYTFRNLAKDIGKDFRSVCIESKNNFDYDRQVDKYQATLAEAGNCVLGSRLAIWIVKNADLKIFLEASFEQRVARIFKREGGTREQVMEETLRRDTSDSNRYKQLYSIDNSNYSFADMIINTDDKNPDMIVSLIIDEIKKRGLK